MEDVNQSGRIAVSSGMERKEARPKCKESGSRVNETIIESKEDARSVCNEKENSFESENAQIRQTLDQEICLRNIREQELRETKAIVEKLQKTLDQENHGRIRLEVESRLVRSSCKELEDILHQQLVEMRRTLSNRMLSVRGIKGKQLREKEPVLDEITKMLGQEKQARARMEGELNQARTDRNLLEERLENELEQMQRTLDNEICFRYTREQELREKGKISDELQKTLDEEQLTRTKMEEKLNQAKTARKELEERLENELKQMQRTLDNEISLRYTREQELWEKGNISDELQKTLDEEQITRTKMKEELSRAKTARKELEERLENELKQMQRKLRNEISLRCTREQELLEKRAIVDELKKTLDGEQLKRTRVEAELNQVRTDRIDLKGRLEMNFYSCSEY
ncbi:hypothetical protein OS493_005091 [Desmophyllum pertusum]|uniref:Uncharacterized protein n=1 Tax=Desmophyllum pertusum TaxID=174260 RepID=A0A9X0CVC8_9CNID|nr:hypothetical protein OS493_005091 [Desmophyllum pertusum]